MATLTANRAELMQTLLAIFQAGWQYVPLNTTLTADEVAYILADSGATALVADERYAGVAAAAADAAGVPSTSRRARCDPGFEPLRDVIAGQPTTMPPDRVAGQFMQYTSGTTGRPKAVQRDLVSFDPETWVALYSANLTRYDIEPGGDAVHLVVSPMYHLSPLSFGYFSLHLEHTVVLMERFDAERVLAADRAAPRHRRGDGAHADAPSRAAPGRRAGDIRRVVVAAGDPRGGAVPGRAEAAPVRLARAGDLRVLRRHRRGGTIAKPHDWLAHPGTVGRPWAGAAVKVLDDDGNELGPGHVGTVYLKLMGDFAYKGDPDKTAANRHGDYFTVGDMGELDEDGFLYLRDRKIDMIISGGVNVYPAEIEGVLLAHPKVGDAAVFGVPSDEWGEEVKAVIEPAPGVDAPDELARSCSTTATCRWPATSARAASTSPTRCRATRTASSTSACCATPTGPGATGGSDDRSRPPRGVGTLRRSEADRTTRERSEHEQETAGHGLACPSKRGTSGSPTTRTSRPGCSGASARAAARCSSRAGSCVRSACTKGATTSSCRPVDGSGRGPTATCRCSARRTPTCPATASARWTCPRGRVQSILFAAADELEIGMDVEIDLETLRENSAGDEVVIYRFRPVAAPVGDDAETG